MCGPTRLDEAADHQSVHRRLSDDSVRDLMFGVQPELSDPYPLLVHLGWADGSDASLANPLI
jgi:hypothetical protein